MTTYVSNTKLVALRGESDPEDAPAIVFAAGLIGCPEWQTFTLREHPELPGIFVMQLMDDPETTFLLAHVVDIEARYLDRLHPDDQAALSAPSEDERSEVEFFCTLNTRDPDHITANLLGPLMIDRAAGIGRQIVLASSPWTAKHPVNGSAEAG